jgi:hypothetical protein
MKRIGIPIKGVKVKDGKLVKVDRPRLSVSAKIAQKKSKKVTVSRQPRGKA